MHEENIMSKKNEQQKKKKEELSSLSIQFSDINKHEGIKNANNLPFFSSN